MTANELEKAIISRMLADPELEPVSRSANLDMPNVTDRAFTGAGFLTEFERSKGTRLFQPGTTLRWGKVGARLNAAKLETGYIVYVDDGYVTTVEGYTYGDPWPERVENIELYTLTLGVDLSAQPG